MVIRIDPGASGVRLLGRYKAAVALCALAGVMAGLLWWQRELAVPHARHPTSAAGGEAAPHAGGTVAAGQVAAMGAAETASTARQRVAPAPLRPASPSLADRRLVSLTDRQKADGRVFIEYEMAHLQGKGVGDEIDLVLPQLMAGGTARIESVIEADGIRTWTGVIRAGDGRGHFSITQAVRGGYVVGNIQSPAGTAYSLEAFEGLGWVGEQGSQESHEEHDHEQGHPHDAI